MIGVEYDPRLILYLREKLGNARQLELVHADILSLDIKSFLRKKGESLVVIGNLPYHITTPILFKCLESDSVSKMIFMIQKEVAERIASKPNSKAYGVLSVMCQFHAETKILMRLKPGAFHPRPEVDSAVIELIRRPFPVSPRDTALFKKLVQTSFQKRRKMLRNSLQAYSSELENRFDWKRRPENLSVSEFVELSNLVHESGKF